MADYKIVIVMRNVKEDPSALLELAQEAGQSIATELDTDRLHGHFNEDDVIVRRLPDACEWCEAERGMPHREGGYVPSGAPGDRVGALGRKWLPAPYGAGDPCPGSEPVTRVDEYGRVPDVQWAEAQADSPATLWLSPKMFDAFRSSLGEAWVSFADRTFPPWVGEPLLVSAGDRSIVIPGHVVEVDESDPNRARIERRG